MDRATSTEAVDGGVSFSILVVASNISSPATTGPGMINSSSSSTTVTVSSTDLINDEELLQYWIVPVQETNVTAPSKLCCS